MAIAAAALTAYGAIRQGQAQKDALSYNAGMMGIEKSQAIAQGVTQEDLVRRNSREQLGKQIAAFGSAGVGYGGSTESSLRSSLMNQEMDALNTRYRAQLAGWGYGQQAQIDRNEAQATGENSELLAGAALLKGLGPYYSTAPKIAAAAN